MTATTAALVGATGGAGTTRTTLGVAAVLASDDRSVAVLDAAYATQGLARHVPGRIRPDLTALLTDAEDAPLADGLVDLEWATPGRVACCPAHAPFERLARAKTTGSARALEARIAEAAAGFDHVLVDTPPVAANQSIAAVHAVDRIGIVAPASPHGIDALQGMRSRLRDLQSPADVSIAVGAGHESDVDAVVPEASLEPPIGPGDGAGDRSPIAAAEALLDGELRVDPGPGGLRGRLARFG